MSEKPHTRKLKYAIKNKLANMTRTEHQKAMKAIMKGIYPNGRRTFYDWRNIGLDDYQEIPLSKQKVIAAALGCPLDELENKKLQPCA